MSASVASKVSSSLPVQASKTGFSEAEVLKHVQALTEVASHPLQSQADLTPALQYVFKESQNIKETADGNVDVQVDLSPVKSGDSDLKNVVVRISPKNVSEAQEDAILVSAHVDTVFSAEGAADDASSVAVMLELARGISQSSQNFKNSVIFLFNTGEEEGLDGSHSFITEHPWSSTIRLAIDLDSVLGKAGVFQAGPHPWARAIENFGSVAKYPSGAIASQDLFSSGVIKSTTDFQVYKEIGGLSGLDFAFTDRTAVYHTKNDKFEFLKPGSLQHLGENMLPFLLQASTSADLPS